MMRKETPPDPKQVMHNNQLMRARRVRANAAYIPHQGFSSRKMYFCQKDGGILMQKFEAVNPMAAMQVTRPTGHPKSPARVHSALPSRTLRVPLSLGSKRHDEYDARQHGYDGTPGEQC